jgi:hypothetical protein
MATGCRLGRGSAPHGGGWAEAGASTGHAVASQRRHAQQWRVLSRRGVGDREGAWAGADGATSGGWAREDGGQVRAVARAEVRLCLASGGQAVVGRQRLGHGGRAGGQRLGRGSSGHAGRGSADLCRV